MPRVEEEFGAPLWVVHRADLQMVLLTAARNAGVDVQTGHHVCVVDFGRGTMGIYPPTKPRYSVNGGEWLEADVILCADGIKSDIRRDMMEIHGQIDHGISRIHPIEFVVSSNIVCRYSSKHRRCRLSNYYTTREITWPARTPQARR